MTHYDMLVDTIVTYLYDAYQDGENGEQWNCSLAEEKAHLILRCVEEFQQKRSDLNESITYLKPRPEWRASD